MFFKLFWYKVFARWKCQLINFLMASGLKNILTSFLWSKLIDHSKLSSICYSSVILLRAFFTAVITFWKKRRVYIREFKGSLSDNDSDGYENVA